MLDFSPLVNYDFRILVFTLKRAHSGALDLFSGIVWILLSEPSQALTPLHARRLFYPATAQPVGI